MINLDRYTSPRLNPSQDRGKERIRLILATALQLFGDKGIDRTTTNDIAEAAHIPIGSVYRYFKNKEEIILAITDLQVGDVVALFNQIASRPDLSSLSWREIIILVTDTWMKHASQNDSFAFLYFLRCNRQLRAETAKRWHVVHLAYARILQKCDPRVAGPGVGVIVQLTWSAVELGIVTNEELSHEAANIVAEHLEHRYPRN